MICRPQADGESCDACSGALWRHICRCIQCGRERGRVGDLVLLAVVSGSTPPCPCGAVCVEVYCRPEDLPS